MRGGVRSNQHDVGSARTEEVRVDGIMVAVVAGVAQNIHMHIQYTYNTIYIYTYTYKYTHTYATCSTAYTIHIKYNIHSLERVGRRGLREEVLQLRHEHLLGAISRGEGAG